MSNINLTKLFVVSFSLIFWFQITFAKKVEGYIVTNKKDTIYGTIQLSRFNNLQQTICVNSYFMEDLSAHVFFKSLTGKRFNEFFPRDIIEYGFILDEVKYRYISKEVKPVWGRNNGKFYLQIMKGAIDLYELRLFMDNHDRFSNPYGMRIIEYYIFDKDENLISVGKNNNYRTVAEFLSKNLNLEKEVLAKVTQGRNFKDIREIVRSYNEQVH